jgi:hypothetical protein
MTRRSRKSGRRTPQITHACGAVAATMPFSAR